jgi:hypothetical protein
MASALDVLMAVAEPSSKKSSGGDKLPTVFRPDKQVECDRFAEIVKRAKVEEAERKMLGADLCAIGEEFRLAEAKRTGSMVGSVKVNNLTYVWQERLSDVTDAGEVARLSALPGMAPYIEEVWREVSPEEYAKLPADAVQKTVAVQIDPSKLDEAWGNALAQMKAAGLVTVVTSYRQRALRILPQYLTDRTLKPEVAALHAQAEVKNVSYMKA